MKTNGKKVLIACEESQAVCIEFRKLGFEAYSCDILPCSGDHPEWHLQQDVTELLERERWDMIIAFPPCTYLCSSGLHWNKRVQGRQNETDIAIQFFLMFTTVKCDFIAIENSIGCMSTEYRKPDQIIQPYNFGENASKATCLWLNGLPKLQNTKYYPPRLTSNNKKRFGNQTDSGQNKLGPSENRGKIRGITYTGIAKAMAEQWGLLL